MFITI